MARAPFFKRSSRRLFSWRGAHLSDFTLSRENLVNLSRGSFRMAPCREGALAVKSQPASLSSRESGPYGSGSRESS